MAALGVTNAAKVAKYLSELLPSMTTWSRLEPLPTSDDTSESLQAKVADPLWMLARQWQFNEFQGEDAGSPIAANYQISGIAINALAGNGIAAQALAGAPPVEALVEREQVLAAHPKLNAQAGQQLLRQLRAAGLGQVALQLMHDFPARIESPQDPVDDNAGFVWNVLLHGKSVDALAVAGELRPLIGNVTGLDAFGQTHGVVAANAATFRTVAQAWMTWLDDLVCDSQTPGASPYWNPHRLEYAFSLRDSPTQPSVWLDADEYTDGKVDWHTFALGGASRFTNTQQTPSVFTSDKQCPPIPTIARYPGMPADRYWEFEDGSVNFGMMGASKIDLTRLAVIEYALVFGNDWFTLPITLPAGALYHVDKLEVTDNFGVVVPIPPARNPDGTPWTLYEMSVKGQSKRQTDQLFLCPAASALEGPALEQVVLMRDEMANLVWGIEKRVQGTSGDALDRKFESNRLSTNQELRPPLDTPIASSGAPLNYILQTPVAANWIPFLPVKKVGATEDNWSIQLQRGVVTHHYQVTPTRLDDPRNADYKAFIERMRNAPFVEHDQPTGSTQNTLQAFRFHPRGSLLRLDPNAPVAGDYLRLEEEEVPREGIQLTRAFNYARDASGRGVLWIGRSKTTGRGEGSSGLRFDSIGKSQGG
jgi:hypothetical protein